MGMTDLAEAIVTATVGTMSMENAGLVRLVTEVVNVVLAVIELKSIGILEKEMQVPISLATFRETVRGSQCAALAEILLVLGLTTAVLRLPVVGEVMVAASRATVMEGAAADMTIMDVAVEEEDVVVVAVAEAGASLEDRVMTGTEIVASAVVRKAPIQDLRPTATRDRDTSVRDMDGMERRWLRHDWLVYHVLSRENRSEEENVKQRESGGISNINSFAGGFLSSKRQIDYKHRWAFQGFFFGRNRHKSK